LTLGIIPLLIAGLVRLYWNSLINNPTKIENLVSLIKVRQDILLNPTKEKLMGFSQEVDSFMDPLTWIAIGIAIVITIAIYFLIRLFIFLFKRFWDKSYPDMGLIDPPIGDPTKFAIIVTGGELNGNLQEDFKLTSGRLYELLLDRGYDDETIIYLNVEETHEIDGENRVDGISCQQNFETAINWLCDYSDSTDQILIYIIDHGVRALFDLGYVILNYRNKLWDKEYENILDNDNLNYQTLICVIEACHSGVFVDKISGPKRIIITSSTSDTLTYIVGGSEPTYSFFGNSFLTGLEDGLNFRDAFKEAAFEIDMENSLNPTEMYQCPLLDDNGDGTGHCNLDGGYLPYGGDGEDTGLACQTYL
jgi:hypothetical protein